MYASQSTHAEFVYARVMHSDGKVQNTPVDLAIEQPLPATTEAPEYSDLKSKQLPIRSLRIGDTLEWQARTVVDHPEVPNQFWGQGNFLQHAVVLDESYELHIPAGLHLTVWTNPHSGVTPMEIYDAGEHIYRWHRTDIKPTVGAAAEAEKKAEATRPRTAEEELDDTKGKLPGIAWSTYPDYSAVGAWYRTLAADRIAPDEAIKAKVAELTAGKTTDMDKARAVYDYVSEHIHYIGIDFGVGRYQPHTAAEVYANQYGDCKDKHTLLASMLSVLNIHAEPVLIGVGIRFNPLVASPSAFNHVITHLTIDGKEVWLDATSEVSPWGALLYPIRDKEALVIPADLPAAVHQTPKDLPYPQLNTMTVTGSLDKDLISDSTIKLTMRGDDELYVRRAMRNVSPAHYSEFVQQFMSGMGFGGTTSEAAINHVDDTAQPLEITFHYHRIKEKDWGENRITAIFQSISAQSFNADNPPVESINLGVERTETSSITMRLPKGWSAELPDDVHAHTPFAQCDVTYKLTGDTLIMVRRYTVIASKVPLKDAKLYQTWYDESGISGVPYIQLVPVPVADTALSKPAPVAPTVASGSEQPADPKAAELVKDAFIKLQSMNLDEGRRELDEAAKINSTQPYLWLGYAAAAELLGVETEMVTDIKREISYHPNEGRVYKMLFELQTRRGNRTEAIVTLRTWEKATPKDPTPAAYLVSLLNEEKKYADAVSEGRGAIARLQSTEADLTGLRIATALAQASAGQGKEAAAAVQPLLKTATDDGQLNNIDYVLAEAATDLDEARVAQESVITKLETDMADVALDTKTSTVMQQEAKVATYWDTLGWILYKQGKLDDAFSYCLAARYIMSDNEAIREHLTTIAAAMHKPSAMTTAAKTDQQIRTIRLAPSNGRRGDASYKLLIAEGKIIGKQNQTSSNIPGQLKGADELLEKADMHALFPPGSSARFVRSGFVNCSSNSCDFILIPTPQ